MKVFEERAFAVIFHFNSQAKDQIEPPQHSPPPVVEWYARKNLPRLFHDEQEAFVAHSFILE